MINSYEEEISRSNRPNNWFYHSRDSQSFVCHRVHAFSNKHMQSPKAIFVL